MNIYNDNDPKVCAWASELVKAGHVAPGSVLCKSIKEVQADELRQATQVHLFAGILGWPLALRLAGWEPTRPIWTGSCPCQPFSAAGKRKGTADERHLWPDMLRLIAECQPATVFGEQVASSDGREWLAGVRTDLEALGYEVGAADLCAASVGAPHIRQRLFWVADTIGNTSQRRSIARIESGPTRPIEVFAQEREWCGPDSTSGGTTGGLADTEGPERQRLRPVTSWQQGGFADAGGLGNATSRGRAQGDGAQQTGQHGEAGDWHRATTIPCGDGKTRRIGPGITPLAHGIPARVVRLRGYGNAIVPQLAAQFIKAYMECIT
jgi:DNA (cytosine-5)-methyltransferase 1